MSEPRHGRGVYSSGDPIIDQQLRALVGDMDPQDADLVFELLATSIRLGKDPVSRLDRKVAASALKEMRYAFSIFARYRDVRKVTIFGSARTAKGDPEYELAREFSQRIADRDWMVVTGAGPGIMQAAQEGAGGARSFGVNILLPFEMQANPVIAGDPKLINFKYFFTRKLMFVKEADAFLLLPGGFGTMDEAFELLTLVQTGKSDLHPIVMLDPPGGTYWHGFENYIRKELLSRGYIYESDMSLFRHTDSVEVALQEIERFFRVYHSQRYVKGRLILRLKLMPSDDQISDMSERYSDMLAGPIEKAEASPAEVRDQDVPHLPRLALDFDRSHIGRLRMLIDDLNEIT
ncbi:MAG TPA: TIGR00730 family Rossman fold protein [Actinomycetota bacterium]|nr:TIGR00730 family Rossman fold protein [Actinomycetota bacterium]